MANPKAEAEKRKREAEKKALDREKLSMSQSKEKLKLSQDFKKAKITLVARHKREKLAMKQSEETKKIKEDWIEDKIIYKLLDRNEKRAAATFKAMSKSEKMKFVDAVQTITSKNYGYTDSEVEDALQDYDIDISKAARKKWEQAEIEQEAANMHKYVNTLSLERSVNLWAEAAKEEDGEDPEPVSGSKTLTKKSQNKVEINPAEKMPQNKCGI